MFNIAEQNGGGAPFNKDFLAASLKQPKALYLLFFAQMWECFSYYGMRVLLVLFMTKSLAYSDHRAFGVYAVYTALVEASGVLGGYLADKILGLRRAIFIGVFVIIIGHLSMALPLGIPTFYLGLGLIIVGTGLFRTNCTALLGLFYEPQDPRRDSGFTLFYVGINIGGFIASLACGYVGETFGWHYGFSLAAFGMLLGNVTLYKFRYLLEGKGMPPQNVSFSTVSLGKVLIFLAIPLMTWMVFYHDIFIHVLPLFLLAAVTYAIKQARGCSLIEQKKMGVLGIFILLLALFFAFEEQLGSTLILFSQRHVDRNLLGFVIPASSLITINPLTIMILGPFISRILQHYQQKKNRPFKTISKISFSFFLLGLAFLAIYLGCFNSNNDQIVKLPYIALGFMMIASAELFVGPVLYAACTALAPQRLLGIMMGMVMLGYSLANLLSGILSKLMAITKEENGEIALEASLLVYSNGFYHITLVCMIIALLVFMCRRFINRLEVEG